MRYANFGFNIHDGEQQKCKVCRRLWPISKMTKQDGGWVCPEDYDLKDNKAKEMNRYIQKLTDAMSKGM